MKKTYFQQLSAERRPAAGQTMVEFSVCMVAVIILMLGLIRVFVWTGKDLVDRRIAHESVLKQSGFTAQGTPAGIRPIFYYSTHVNAAVGGDLYSR